MSNFPDVTNHWAKDFIQGLRSRNIVSGFPDGSFRPNKNMSRAEYAALLSGAFPLPAIRKYDEEFVDFSPYYWAAGAIKKAYESGFLSGFPQRRFRPLDPITRVQVLVSLVNGLKLDLALESDPKMPPLAEIYEDAATIPNYGREAIAIATQAGLVVNYPDLNNFSPNQAATRAEVSIFIYQALVFLGRIPVLNSEYLLSLPLSLTHRGTTISLQVNLQDRSHSARWGQWRRGASLRTGLRDADAQQVLGIEMLDTSNAKIQPIAWFSQQYDVETRLEGGDRFLDLTDLALAANWQVQIQETILSLILPSSQLKTLLFEPQGQGAKITLNLERAISWQLRSSGREWSLTLDATADRAVLDGFGGSGSGGNADATDAQNEGETGGSGEAVAPPTVESRDGRTVLRGNLPDGLGLRAAATEAQIVLELQPDALVQRDILWTEGLRWQQKYVSLGTDRFPVAYLTCDRAASQLQLRPIWTQETGMKGTEPLLRMAQQWQVMAAINGGFFNRQTLLPLGAIRFEGEWLSGPILNRGAIAWNESGTIVFDRLALNETLTNQAGQTFPLLFLNSGYYRGGISRYTTAWGDTYTTFIDNEVAIAVENNRVVRHINGGAAGTTTVSIPQNGYLLVLRANASVAAALGVGTTVTLNRAIAPSEFDSFSNTLAAGPLLLVRGQNVLDVVAEGFDRFFAQQAAIRSIVGTTETGELILAAIHNRVGGRGPTLPETVELVQQLGMVNALNLDGGSSTGLYLGGQLLDRSPSTAARVQNGLALQLLD
ncbi:MAG: S-layer homology domain-containing protein [Cyanobacteriota bacterium]|nr:S-layer homology domain-containing protein [Cyanobacteriota bacterium]